jgi:hypothetical protein
MAAQFAVLPALGWGLTALGTAATIPSLMDIPRATREQILRDGPDADGNFHTNWLQNWLIDQQSLPAQWQNRKYKEDLSGPRAGDIFEIERLIPGAKFKPGMNALQFVQQNMGKLKKAQRKESVADAIGLRESLYYSGPAIAERTRLANQAADARRDANRQWNLTWQSMEDARRDRFNLDKTKSEQDYKISNRNIQLGMMDLDRQDQLNNRQLDIYEKQHADTLKLKRDASTQALTAGLFTLGASFFV